MKPRKSQSEKLNEIWQECKDLLYKMYGKVQSEHASTYYGFRIPERWQIVLDINFTEIMSDGEGWTLFDRHGYQYGLDNLSCEQLCELTDMLTHQKKGE